jgi:hypothetical protein
LVVLPFEFSFVGAGDDPPLGVASVDGLLLLFSGTLPLSSILADEKAYKKDQTGNE